MEIIIGEIYKNNKGIEYIVLEKIDKNIYRIKFIISGHEKDVLKYNIINGSIRDPLIVIGEVRINKSGLEYIILEKIDKNTYRIKFIESGYETDASTSSVLSGYIRDNIATKCVYEVGTKFTNASGLEFTIIEKYDSAKVRIKFTQSGFEDDVWTSHIGNKLIRDKTELKYIVGKRFTNNRNLEFEIIEKYNADKFRVRFIKSGYETDTIIQHVSKGDIKDKYSPSVAGVGCIGDYNGIVQGLREYDVWAAMLKRCYVETDKNYRSYGAKGVHVCNRWLNFNNFYNDIHNLPGYDKDLFDNGLIELDKDYKQLTRLYCEKIYSPETCIFLNSEINMYIRHCPEMYINSSDDQLFISAYIIPAILV